MIGTRLIRGVLVGLIHVGLVAGVGAKLLTDRAAYPRVWARALPYDPELPIRGRYVQLRLEATIGEGLTLPEATTTTNADGTVFRHDPIAEPVRVSVGDGNLIVLPVERASGMYARRTDRNGITRALLMQPVVYFIPDDVPDPSVREPGEELWVEVTVPPTGPPRPIQLGVRRNGVLTPLVID